VCFFFGILGRIFGFACYFGVWRRGARGANLAPAPALAFVSRCLRASAPSVWVTVLYSYFIILARAADAPRADILRRVRRGLVLSPSFFGRQGRGVSAISFFGLLDFSGICLGVGGRGHFAVSPFLACGARWPLVAACERTTGPRTLGFSRLWLRASGFDLRRSSASAASRASRAWARFWRCYEFRASSLLRVCSSAFASAAAPAGSGMTRRSEGNSGERGVGSDEALYLPP
jgi:hypothetical protein